MRGKVDSALPGLESGRSLEYFNSLKMDNMRLTGFSETPYALFQDYSLRCLSSSPFGAVRYYLLVLRKTSWFLYEIFRWVYKVHA
jgi:hypothetical protein